MSDDNGDTSKTHYICQTYVDAEGTKGAPAGVRIDKQFQYSTAQEAESRAERASQSSDCAGADAYMIKPFSTKDLLVKINETLACVDVWKCSTIF